MKHSKPPRGRTVPLFGGLSLLAQRPAKVVTCPWRRSS